MVAAAYVTDIDASRAFYGLLGFREHSSGKAEASAWSVMQHDGVSVLLASTGPALDIPALPLLFYFFCDDIEAVAGVLEGAGVPVVRTGHPPHALGGEVKVLDPDGNTVLLGQRAGRGERRRAAGFQDAFPHAHLLVVGHVFDSNTADQRSLSVYRALTASSSTSAFCGAPSALAAAHHSAPGRPADA
jgi:catechol 2,3-dioxygenase-like lactoylglutathione lyase family enzyme